MRERPIWQRHPNGRVEMTTVAGSPVALVAHPDGTASFVVEAPDGRDFGGSRPDMAAARRDAIATAWLATGSDVKPELAVRSPSPQDQFDFDLDPDEATLDHLLASRMNARTASERRAWREKVAALLDARGDEQPLADTYSETEPFEHLALELRRPSEVSAFGAWQRATRR
jgi:hypothetical protein